MAKDKNAAPVDVTVRLHSEHEATGDQYEILAAGRRVAYATGERITFLTPQAIGLKLAAAEVEQLVAAARPQLAERQAARRAEAERLAALLAGEP